MSDREVEIGSVIAWGLTGMVGILLLMSWLLADDDVGRVALAMSAAAAVAHVRCYFVRQSRMLRAAIDMQARRESTPEGLRGL